MDKTGQLTFSDDPLLNGSNEVYQLIEEGNFKEAVEKLDELMSIDPEYPGLIEAYRIAKFWFNREKDLCNFDNGKRTADFLMSEWETFNEYSENNNLISSAAYNAVMRHIFFKASELYKMAFQKQEETTNNFDLLLNLGDCFLKIEKYQNTIDTLEYARSSYKSNARLLSILGEAYFHVDDLPKTLLYFREAFFINPTEIDMSILKAKPILDLIEIVKKEIKEYKDIREWIPVYGFIKDIFFVRKNLSKHQLEGIQREIYNLEISYQKMNKEQIINSNIRPRLINKYLWMLEYHEVQNYSYENLIQIRERLMKIDKDIFKSYFKKADSKP